MKTRETKKQNRSSVILSEATDGVNKVRLIGSARAEEEEACPWEEIDDYSGRFVMAGYSRYEENPPAGREQYYPWIIYSTNGGETWDKNATTSGTNYLTGQLHALAYGGGRFVVAGYRYGIIGTDTSNNYHPWIAYSTDGGKTWTPNDTTSDENQTHGRLHALAYGGGRFVVAGWRHDSTDDNHPWIAYSTDGGKTWTPSETTSDESQPHGRLYALAYGGGRFVVAGYRYDINDSSDNYHPWIAYSTDGGKTWTPSETTSDESQTHGQLHALAYGGGRFVVAGYRYDGEEEDEDNYHPWIAYSTDGGKTWTPNDTTSDKNQTHGRLYALAYGGGRFVVGGYSHDEEDYYHPWIAYSTDGGETWEKNTTTSSGGISDERGLFRALTYAPDSYCWKFGKEEEEKEE